MSAADERLEGEEQAHEIIRANTSPRYKRLAHLESWVEGRQYDGRPSWWDDGVPLWERRPCIVYPVASVAIGSFVDLIFGEGRFPNFSSKPGEHDGEDESGLEKEAATSLDRFLADYHKKARFRAHCREALGAAMGCGTAVAIHGARNGRPFAELVPARWCEPRMGIEREVLSVEIRYPYREQYRKPDGKWAVRVKLFRRTIDANQDVTYLPADADERGDEPKSWRPDPAQSVSHGFGFTPVIWYPFMRGCAPVNQIDGKAIHQNLTDEIEQHDIALSQRHRGALLSEPQICEIGVPPGYNPTELGRAPGIPSTEGSGEYRDFGSPKTARKKGPGYPWQYTSHETRVEMLTYPGDALKAQSDNAADLYNKLQESLACVLLDPHNIKFAATTSGKALEAIKQRQIDRASIYRDDVADNFLLLSVDMQLRIAKRLGRGLRVGGANKIEALLSKFETADAVDQP